FYESADVSGQGQSGVRAERVMVCDPSRPGFCPGYALGTFYGPVFLEVDPTTGQQVFFCTAATTGCVNGRTTISGNPAAADYRVIGNANPDFTLGWSSQISWNRFDVSFLVRAVVGQDVFNNTALVYSSKGNAIGGSNILRPAVTDPTGIHEPAIYSSRWIESASFVRMQNVTVGYDLIVPQACTNLDETPLSLITPGNFFHTEPEVLAGLAGVYAQLRSTAPEGGLYDANEVSTDEIVVPIRGKDWNDNGQWIDLHNVTWTPTSIATTNFFNGAWNTAYTGVARANLFLSAMENSTVPNKARYVAEGRTLRAFYYYLLM